VPIPRWSEATSEVDEVQDVVNAAVTPNETVGLRLGRLPKSRPIMVTDDVVDVAKLERTVCETVGALYEKPTVEVPAKIEIVNEGRLSARYPSGNAHVTEVGVVQAVVAQAA